MNLRILRGNEKGLYGMKGSSLRRGVTARVMNCRRGDGDAARERGRGGEVDSS